MILWRRDRVAYGIYLLSRRSSNTSVSSNLTSSAKQHRYWDCWGILMEAHSVDVVNCIAIKPIPLFSFTEPRKGGTNTTDEALEAETLQVSRGVS